MSSKLLVIVASGDREKVLTALMYARNAIKNSWLDDVKVVFFGPSEKLAAEDMEVSAKAKEIAAIGESIACKAISDKQGVSDNLAKLGIKIEYVGTIISNLIKDGYAPMVW